MTLNILNASELLQDGLIVPVDEFLNSSLPQRNIYGVERLRGSEKEKDDKLDYTTFLKLTVSCALHTLLL